MAVAILAMLSLSVSSVAACACSHHTSRPDPKNSCHSTAHHETSDPGIPAFDESCACFLASTEISVKAESFKLKKHVAAFRDALAPLSAIVGVAGPASQFEIRSALYERLAHSPHFSRGPPNR